MKRFYCTICQRVKRVRVIPSSVRNHGDDVRMREGVCSWHRAKYDDAIMTGKSAQGMAYALNQADSRFNRIKAGQ